MLKIGVFDSGLGGLTIVQAISQIVQNAEIYYVADTLNAPYGDKTPHQILQYSIDITNHLITNHDIDTLIVACNTATSWSISHLRELYPSLIIIGTEPGIKPAIEVSSSGKIGVLATLATLKGEKYQRLADRLSVDRDIEIYQQACPSLVEQIEKGDIESEQTRKLLEDWLKPMSDSGVDTVVLGCTHYPLIAHIIEDIMPKGINIIDTREAISKHLLYLSTKRGHINSGKLDIYIETTGEIKVDIIDMIISDYRSINFITISTHNS